MTTERLRSPLPLPSSPNIRRDEVTDPDALLLRRMADGDEAALGVLYDRWVDRVHTVAFWILKDADEAEDVVEETFWQVWRSAARYDPHRSSGATWLILIARSRALDRLRAQRRRADWTVAPFTAGALLGGSAEMEASATPQTESGDYSRLLTEAIRALPVEQREALELAYFAGLSHSEIATRIAQPLGTVKTRIRLAMDKLRQRLSHLRDELL